MKLNEQLTEAEFLWTISPYWEFDIFQIKLTSIQVTAELLSSQARPSCFKTANLGGY